MDFYGFPLRLSAQQAEARKRCDASEKKQEKAWAKYAKRGQVPTDDTCKKMCRKGIPPMYRAAAWFEISGAAAHAASKGPNYYRSMVDLGRGSSTDKGQIDTDLPRTFPDNIWLCTREAQHMLQRVLLAYSMHNPQVGYCQGLNYLAGMLLLVLQKDEERAFWILVTLLDEGILYDDMYSHNLLGAHVEMQSLAELVIEKMPKLAAHLSAAQCDITIVATDWFLCLFCTSLPSETAMRIWDALLCEGPKIIYRVSLALLQTNEPALMQIQDAGSMLRHLRAANQSIHDRDALMTVAFEHVGSMPMQKIVEFRAQKQSYMANDFRRQQSKKNLQRSIQRNTSLSKSTSGEGLKSAEGLAEEQSRIKRAYSGTNGSSPGPTGGGFRAGLMRKAEAVTKAVGGYTTPPPTKSYAPEPIAEPETMITIRDVTKSANGDFAGTIVQGEKLIMSPQYEAQ